MICPNCGKEMKFINTYMKESKAKAEEDDDFDFYLESAFDLPF